MSEPLRNPFDPRSRRHSGLLSVLHPWIRWRTQLLGIITCRDVVAATEALMRVIKKHVTRQEVILAYARYDLSKKGRACLPSDIDHWQWEDPGELDKKLRTNGLKDGVLAAYLHWQLVEVGLIDLLECAIFNGIFPGQPQSLSRIVLNGKVADWHPDRNTDWFDTIKHGTPLTADSPLIIRPSVRSEAPAKWYVEDGSGRALALLQRMLDRGELETSAYAFVGIEPDLRSSFITARPELVQALKRL
jgi:hypothetical protein